MAPPGTAFVIVRLAVDFRAELQWQDQIDIGTAVLGIGGRSFRLGQGLFRDGACVAAAESVMMLIDQASRRAVELPDQLRRQLSTFAAPAGS
jgi:acyl-CoA thioester hydrolase